MSSKLVLFLVLSVTMTLLFLLISFLALREAWSMYSSFRRRQWR